jgi:hypothetical protein
LNGKANKTRRHIMSTYEEFLWVFENFLRFCFIHGEILVCLLK